VPYGLSVLKFIPAIKIIGGAVSKILNSFYAVLSKGPRQYAGGTKISRLSRSSGVLSKHTCQRRIKNASACPSKNTSVMLARRPPNWGPFVQASGLDWIIRH
jgi:hypothetical protein